MTRLPIREPGAAGTPRRLRLTPLLLAALLALSGCGVVGVEVWERDLLADPDMLLDADALDHAADEHIYFSKEASSGGYGFGGGGCGCN